MSPSGPRPSSKEREGGERERERSLILELSKNPALQCLNDHIFDKFVATFPPKIVNGLHLKTVVLVSVFFLLP